MKLKLATLVISACFVIEVISAVVTVYNGRAGTVWVSVAMEAANDDSAYFALGPEASESWTRYNSGSTVFVSNHDVTGSPVEVYFITSGETLTLL